MGRLIRLATVSPPTVAKNLAEVYRRVSEACRLTAGKSSNAPAILKSAGSSPRIVAVSKEKPIELILEAYRCGQRTFGENKKLVRCREIVAQELGKNPSELDLSMGMSNDFEHAIALGSTNVRIGSTIFGTLAREPQILRLDHIARMHGLCIDPSRVVELDPMENKGARFRVTGAMLPNLSGRDVCLVGTVVRVAPSGRQFTLRTADGPEIECNFQLQLQVSPENMVVEVQGRVSNTRGSELVASSNPTIFSSEASAKFDADLYAEAIQMTAQFDRFYIQPTEA